MGGENDQSTDVCCGCRNRRIDRVQKCLMVLCGGSILGVAVSGIACAWLGVDRTIPDLVGAAIGSVVAGLVLARERLPKPISIPQDRKTRHERIAKETLLRAVGGNFRTAEEIDKDFEKAKNREF